MPTGFTSELYDGEQTFEEFVMRAARGMGALITMRDAPMDAPIPEEFKPSSYYVDRVAEAKERVEEVTRWTHDDARREAEKAYGEALARYDEMTATAAERRVRYLNMIERVEAWEPPTPEHDGFKDFMLSQLRESMDFDCSTYGGRPERQTPTAFLTSEIEKAQQELKRARQSLAEEQERARERTQWVSALRASLDQKTVPA